MVLAKPLQLRCPRCKNLMNHFTEIIFVEGFVIVVNGICCGAEITSGELKVLDLFPSKGTEERTH